MDQKHTDMENKSLNFPFVRTLVILPLFLLISYMAAANIVILNGLSHIHTVEDGQIVKGAIEIQNTGDKTRAVRMYQKDYLFDYKGKVEYLEPNTVPRSNATWLDYSPSYLELAPQEKNVILYELKIPEGGDLNGSYWSLLMIEGVDLSKKNPAPGEVSIQTIIRYGIQIVANVGETGKRNLEFVAAEVNEEDGQKYSTIAVENTGERLLIPNISLELFDENGLSVGIAKAEKKKIYPGTSASFYVELDEFPSGEYQAIVLADCSEEDVFGLNLTLKIDDE